MTRFLLALLLSACSGQVNSAPGECGPVPDPSEGTESGFVDYCGQPQLQCGTWEAPWGKTFDRYYAECDGTVYLWVGDGLAVYCSEEWET